jgi:hypothetical protein
MRQRLTPPKIRLEHRRLSPRQQQRDHDRGQGADGEPKRDPGDLIARREPTQLLLNEIEFLHELCVGFSRLIDLTKREAVGV